MFEKISIYDTYASRLVNNAELTIDLDGSIKSVYSNDMACPIINETDMSRFQFFKSVPFWTDKNDADIFIDMSIICFNGTHGTVLFNSLLMSYELKPLTEPFITIPLNPVICKDIEVVDDVFTNKLGLIESKHNIGEDYEENRYCINCGEDEDFNYIRSTASHSTELSTKHYECGNCGESLSFIEPK